MTTKEYGWFTKKKNCLNNQSQTDKSNKFFNLNLNQSSKCSDGSLSVSLFSKSKNDKSFGYTVTTNYQENATKSWNKSNKGITLKTSKKLFYQHEEKSQKSWKNDSKNSNAKNASTLSLHIAAYENSVEAASNESEDFSNKSKIFKSVVPSLQNNQDSFEFPRQMDGNNPSESEVQQFKSSQKLLSPNQENEDSQKSSSPVDENNNNNNSNKENLVSTCPSNTVATTTTNKNLTVTDTVSETGPLMKVVVSPQRGPVELLDSTDGATIIYTDASLIKDGTAGIGIHFGKDHPLNTSDKLPGRHKSVGWAEIMAATVALQKLRKYPNYNKEPVILRTDHLMIVEAMQIAEITSRSHPKFFVELQTLKKIAQDFPKGVQFEHVYAHNGDEGNEEADALATKATSKRNLPSPRRTRSKPPSRRMAKRTRSAYIKRSAPPKVHGGRKGKSQKR